MATGEFCLDFDSEEEREKFDQEIDFFVLSNFIEKLQEVFSDEPDFSKSKGYFETMKKWRELGPLDLNQWTEEGKISIDRN